MLLLRVLQQLVPPVVLNLTDLTLVGFVLVVSPGMVIPVPDCGELV